MQYRVVQIFGLPHHRKYVLGVVGRVRVAGRVAEGVVHPVQNRVSPWTQVRRTLREVGQRVEKALPKFAHREHFMGRVAVQKERLAEQGQIPVPDERGQYENHRID